MFGNTRVMVVEDGEIERVALAELLRFWGYETETASDGLEALEKMPSFRPGLVISDLQMPGMGGIELLEALRKSHPDVDCIIVTGYGALEQGDLVTALGALDYLEKPVDPERLRIDLRKCAQHARAHVHPTSSEQANPPEPPISTKQPDHQPAVLNATPALAFFETRLLNKICGIRSILRAAHR